MQVQEVKYQGLVADLLPNVRLMRIFGHFIFNYSSGPILLKKIYACFHMILLFFQFFGIVMNMMRDSDLSAEMTANTITTLFFTHSIVKLLYFALGSRFFYRTWAIWNQSHSHPLFTESDARYHQIAVSKMRKLLVFIVVATVLAIVAWVTVTFWGPSQKEITDKLTNETYFEEIPRLPIKSWYPWNAMSGINYMASFAFQVYYLLFSLLQSNLADVLFCSWLIFACEQLQHLKGIMKPLMELSASLDTYRPNSAALFRTASANSKSELVLNEETEYNKEYDMSAIYTTKTDWGAQFRAPSTLQNFTNGNGANPNGLTRKQEMMVQSAIKYWVERHKHVVRLVSGIGETYGVALLLHMLISTITLTLLAYQATGITGVNPFAASVIGYLSYTLAQVFLFCIFGNRLIEESSSVMEAAYSCTWYDGSEEAKTFVQIVCQQCQKALTISGAKFFTVSLDLFASVLGAVVTYFMVLVQLK